jgi:hypothetical protein
MGHLSFMSLFYFRKKPRHRRGFVVSAQVSHASGATSKRPEMDFEIGTSLLKLAFRESTKISAQAAKNLR